MPPGGSVEVSGGRALPQRGAKQLFGSWPDQFSGMTLECQLEHLSAEKWERAPHAECARRFPVHRYEPIRLGPQRKVAQGPGVTGRPSLAALEPLAVLVCNLRSNEPRECLREGDHRLAAEAEPAVFRPTQYVASTSR